MAEKWPRNWRENGGLTERWTTEYHVCRPAEGSGELEKTLSYTLCKDLIPLRFACTRVADLKSINVADDIPKERAIDGSVWFLLFRQMVYPDKHNGPAALYEQLLPYLNKRPLLHNMQDISGSSWEPLPISSDRDTSRIAVVLEALRQVCTFAGLTPHYAHHCSTLVCWTLAQKVELDLRTASFLPTSDAKLVQFIGQGLAKLAARDSKSSLSPISASDCKSIARCVEALDSGAERHLPNTLPPAIPDSLGEQLPATVCNFPRFGRLRRDLI